jgi:hypothetical protein
MYRIGWFGGKSVRFGTVQSKLHQNAPGSLCCRSCRRCCLALCVVRDKDQAARFAELDLDNRSAVLELDLIKYVSQFVYLRQILSTK